MRLNRAGEIDYYEELGVERDASPEVIRDSFRALVRLLHPDQQTDEHLKSIAEMQMRKVNRIYSVLSDPERRRRYDELLDEEFIPHPIVFNPGTTNITAKALITRIVWIGASMLAVAVVIWFATDPPAGPTYAAPDRAYPAAARSNPVSAPLPAKSETAPGAAETPANSEEVARLRSELRAARFERDEARRELTQLRASDGVSERAPVLPPDPEEPLISTSTNIADLAPSRPSQSSSRGGGASSPNAAGRNFRPAGSDPHQFAGFWFFARNSAAAQPEPLSAGIHRSDPDRTERSGSRQVPLPLSDCRPRDIARREFRIHRIARRAESISCPWMGMGGARVS